VPNLLKFARQHVLQITTHELIAQLCAKHDRQRFVGNLVQVFVIQTRSIRSGLCRKNIPWADVDRYLDSILRLETSPPNPERIAELEHDGLDAIAYGFVHISRLFAIRDAINPAT